MMFNISKSDYFIKLVSRYQCFIETALFNNNFAYCPTPSVLRGGFFQRGILIRSDDWRNALQPQTMHHKA
jgi:hypothetical protein